MNLNISTWEYFKDEVIVVLVDNLRFPYRICLCRLLEVSFPIALSFISISIQAWFLFIRQNGYKLKLQSSQFWPVGTTADHFQYSREVTGSLFEFNFILTNQRLIPKFGMKLCRHIRLNEVLYQALFPILRAWSQVTFKGGSSPSKIFQNGNLQPPFSWTKERRRLTPSDRLTVSNLNQFISNEHFQMENILCLKQLLNPNDFMAKLDLSGRSRGLSTIPSVYMEGPNIPISSPAIRVVHGPKNIHESFQTCQ
jgi:hypothetical protein